MSNPTNTTTQNVEESGAFDQTGRIMVVSIIVLLVVIIFVVFLHLYAKWYWHRVSNDSNNINHRRRMDFAAGHRELSAGTELRHGLDSAFLKTIPVVVFSLQDFEDGLECSVCLSEVSQGEDTRLLPKCNHIFHVECIDMWFQSHSTCPICRNPVLNSNPTTTTPDLSQEMVRQNTIVEEDDRLDNGGGVSTEALSFPTNVLYWGNEVQVSTLASCLENEDVASSASSLVIATGRDDNTGDGHLVIEIPRQIIEDEDQKSPVQKRMRSLKKPVSRDRKLNPSSPTTAADVEQPAGRSQT